MNLRTDIELNAALGYYTPSFFYTKIHTLEDLSNLNICSEETRQVFLHEYIHYLQDITTAFGLMNIARISDIQREINKYCIDNIYSEIEVPFRKFAGVATSNIQFFKIYIGDSKTTATRFTSVDKVEKVPNSIIPDFEMIPSIEIELNGTYPTKAKFGSIAIQESMAYLIENELFEAVQPAPTFPYDAAKLVAKCIYPEVAGNNLNLIALCDVSLNHHHPGLEFVDILRSMKSDSFLPSNPGQIYEYSLDKFAFGIDALKFSEAFRKMSDLALGKLSGYFTSEVFKNSRRWASLILNEGKALRLTDSRFWLGILQGDDKTEKNRRLYALVNDRFGMPLMSNSHGAHYFRHPKLDMGKDIFLMRAVHQIHKMFVTGKKQCDISDACKITPVGDITNDKCIFNPWERSSDVNVCAYGAIIKSWGLSSLKIK